MRLNIVQDQELSLLWLFQDETMIIDLLLNALEDNIV